MGMGKGGGAARRWPVWMLWLRIHGPHGLCLALLNIPSRVMAATT